MTNDTLLILEFLQSNQNREDGVQMVLISEEARISTKPRMKKQIKDEKKEHFILREISRYYKYYYYYT